MIGIKKWGGRATAVTAVTVATTLAFSGLAFADTVENDVDAVGDYTISAGSSTTIGYQIQVQGAGLDGQGGCNANDGTPATVTLGVPAGVTATTTSLTFNRCATNQYVTFSAAQAGDYPITITRVTDSGVGTYVTTPADFTLKVSAPPPPANTEPSVSVTGVSNGSTYEKSSVPQPGCSVTDAEDTGESATPRVSNGAFDALGSHTVTCSYTDGGNLTGSDTATYTVVRDRDTTAPVITKTVTGTMGLNGWYTSNVSLDWTVTEDESPETLVLTGCDDVTVSADQAATDYSCSANSEGGTAAQQTVSIQRDGTAPAVGYTSAIGTAGTSGWYTSDVVATFTGTDSLSGPASATQTATTSGEGSAVSVSSPAFTDNAGNTTAAGAVSSPAFKIDKSAPNAPTADVNPEPNAAGWNKDTVSVTFTSKGDNGPSGVASCTPSVVVAAETLASGQAVSGTCTDNAGHVSTATQVTVKLDKTGPAVSYTSATGTAGDNGWYTSDVIATFTGTDSLSGPASATQTATSTGEGSAVTVSSPAFTDNADNTTAAGAASASFKVDKTNPTASFNGSIGSVYFGSVPAAPTCTSADSGSGPAGCSVTGYSTAVGTHTLTATASDNAGRTGTTSQTYTVLAWTAKGFYSPVDMGGVWNTVKGGSTVPLKFELFAGLTELTSTSAIDTFTVKGVACPSTGAVTDDIELVTTGGTSLRYDSTGGQFIQNWQTPKKPGACYAVTMTADDGSTITANFLLK